jgi:hypothetical protein
METDIIITHQDKPMTLDLAEDLGYLGPDPTAVVGILTVSNDDGSNSYYHLVFAISDNQS